MLQSYHIQCVDQGFSFHQDVPRQAGQPEEAAAATRGWHPRGVPAEGKAAGAPVA